VHLKELAMSYQNTSD